jgi:small subunit ribosomal protein S8
MTDPIADMLTRIRNAQAVRKVNVAVPFSVFKHNLAKLLVAEGWLSGVEHIAAPKGSGSFDELRVTLKYTKSGKPAIINLRRISKPGRRVYRDADSLPRVLNGLGTAIISTSQGLLTSQQARRTHLGGEIICEIY